MKKAIEIFTGMILFMSGMGIQSLIDARKFVDLQIAKKLQVSAAAAHQLVAPGQPPLIGNQGQAQADPIDPFKRQIMSFGDDGGRSVFVIGRDWYGTNFLLDSVPNVHAVGMVFIDPVGKWTVVDCGQGNFKLGIH